MAKEPFPRTKIQTIGIGPGGQVLTISTEKCPKDEAQRDEWWQNQRDRLKSFNMIPLYHTTGKDKTPCPTPELDVVINKVWEGDPEARAMFGIPLETETDKRIAAEKADA